MELLFDRHLLAVAEVVHHPGDGHAKVGLQDQEMFTSRVAVHRDGPQTGRQGDVEHAAFRSLFDERQDLTGDRVNFKGKINESTKARTQAWMTSMQTWPGLTEQPQRHRLHGHERPARRGYRAARGRRGGSNARHGGPSCR